MSHQTLPPVGISESTRLANLLKKFINVAYEDISPKLVFILGTINMISNNII